MSYASTLESLSGVSLPEHIARKVFALREINQRRRLRAQTAQTIRELRSEWRQRCGTGREQPLRHLCQHVLSRPHPYFSLYPNPTYRNLKAEAKRLIAFSKTPIPSYSTEYYSACGAEDAAGDRRDQAREHGTLLLIAAKLVKAGGAQTPRAVAAAA